VDIGVVSQETFLRGVEEIGSVIDTSLFAGSTSKDFWLPGVQVAVKMDHADGPVFTKECSQFLHDLVIS